MPDRPGTPVELRRRAEELAREGRWSELCDLLEDQEEGRLLGNHRLAYLYGQGLYYTGRMDELSGFVPRFEEAAREMSDALGVMRALNLAGNTWFELGDTERAQSAYERLMDLAVAEDEEEMQAHAATNLGALANLRGETDEALAYYQLAAPLYEKLEQVHGLARMHHNLGISYRDKGWLYDSLEEYRRAERLAAEIGFRPQVAMSVVGRAEVEHRREDAPLALELAARGLQEARAVEDPVTEADALRVRALARVAADDESDEALADLERGRELARRAKNTLLEAEIDRDTGVILLATGRGEEAAERLRSALRLFESLGATADAARLRERLETED